MGSPAIATTSRAEADGYTDKEVRMYRALAVFAAGAMVVYGVLFRMLLPGIVDPWLHRGVVAGACLIFVGLSFLPGRPGFGISLHALFVLITAWVLNLIRLNAFAGEYAIGLLMIVSLVSAIIRTPSVLALFGAATLTGVTLVAAAVPAPRVNPLLFVSHLIVVLVVFLAASWARRRAAHVLAASEARYALTARGAHDGLWDWDVAAGTVYYSPRWEDIIGCADEGIEGTPEAWLARVHPEDAVRVRAELFRTHAPTGSLFELEYRIAHRDGAYRWVHVRGVRVADAQGAVVRMAGSQTDISDRKRAEAQLTHQAYHDTLTGLANRARFRQRLAQAAADPAARATLAVLYIDLDDFKGVNDTHGHAAGDTLLVEVAQRLLNATRGCDTVARLGGDEFAVLLRGVRDAGEAVIVAERVTVALALPIDVHGAPTRVGASVGIALGRDAFGVDPALAPTAALGVSDGTTDVADDLLRFADAAMYAAKHGGKGSHAVFDPAMHRRARERRALEQDLRGAAERGELVLHYQPIVALDSGRVVSAEALVRWQHPTRGMVSPADFIPVAERTGCIVEIGRWVLEAACREAVRWRAAGASAGTAPSVAVNLSAAQLQRPELVDEVRVALTAAGLPAAALTLEITETAMLADTDAAVARLGALKALGVALAVDDFGTGYSSLSYLQRFPVDVLKIDRTFVDRVAVPDHDPVLTRAIVALGAALGLRVVAEGIERPAQAAALAALGCALGQGYHFARPLPAADFAALVAAAPWMNRRPAIAA